MESPAWLNTNFLSAAMDDGQQRADVLRYEVGPAVTEGSNYLGCLYRVKLYFKRGCSEEIQSASLIIKAPLINSFIKTFGDKLNVTAREVEIYNILLPQINSYLEEYKIAPKKYFSLRDDVLVLEDLNSKGYSMCNRIEQLDRDHCLSCMRAIAKFHASSIALYEANPELIERVGKEVLFAEGTGWYEHQNNYIKKCLTYTANGLKTVKEYEKLGEMVLGQIDLTWDKIVRVFSRETHIKVLNHGDMWTNNILFKYDKHGRVADVKLIDFQICRYATPAIDLQYFLTSCPNADVRLNGFNDLLDEYRKTLNTTLSKLNCNIQLSAEELEEEIRSSEPYTLFAACTLLPTVVVDPENPPRVVDDETVNDSLDPNVNRFLQMYYNRRFLDLVVEHLRQLEASGYFS